MNGKIITTFAAACVSRGEEYVESFGSDAWAAVLYACRIGNFRSMIITKIYINDSAYSVTWPQQVTLEERLPIITNIVSIEVVSDFMERVKEGKLGIADIDAACIGLTRSQINAAWEDYLRANPHIGIRLCAEVVKDAAARFTTWGQKRDAA